MWLSSTFPNTSSAGGGSSSCTIAPLRAYVPCCCGRPEWWLPPCRGTSNPPPTRWLRLSRCAMTTSDATLTVGAVAHGGHCVARAEGRVVFVRHALPGETVVARFTEAEPDARFWRADAITVIEASSDLVEHPW